MTQLDDGAVSDKTRRLRRNDFWTAIALIATSLFFIWRTFDIPFFRANAAGVESGRWYNSAALIPFGIFTALLILSLALLWIAIRDGGAPKGLRDVPIKRWALSDDGLRVLAASTIMLAYIFGLTPRVDFILASALTLAASIYGFHVRRRRALAIAVVAVLAPAVYGLIAHFPPSAWATPHDDDWATLGAFVALSVAMMVESRASGGPIDPYIRWTPALALAIPFILVCAMAFGFRQNVPNRTGLLFQQIEYHWFVTVRPALFG